MFVVIYFIVLVLLWITYIIADIKEIPGEIKFAILVWPFAIPAILVGMVLLGVYETVTKFALYLRRKIRGY